ncbi:MAG: hypothetical protein NT121_02045, partial [Chloroflexi bacterium]|nr:hypothetical protein [Chloroflexota bacterium]
IDTLLPLLMASHTINKRRKGMCGSEYDQFCLSHRFCDRTNLAKTLLLINQQAGGIMNSFYFWDEMAAGHLKSDNFEEAIQAYKNALKSTTDCVQQAFVWANIGNIYLSLKNTPSAVDAFLSASLLDPASYDFDSILERITSSGCLDKTALVLAKDMYAKDVETISATAETSVEIAQEEIAP